MGIKNDSYNDLGSFQSFATILDFTYDGTFYDAIVLFDDSGAGPDDDGDDHIIGIRAVPEPAIIALFATGLLETGFSRRKNAQLITAQLREIPGHLSSGGFFMGVSNEHEANPGQLNLSI